MENLTNKILAVIEYMEECQSLYLMALNRLGLPKPEHDIEPVLVNKTNRLLLINEAYELTQAIKILYSMDEYMAAIKLFEKGLLAHEEIVSGIKRVWLEGVEPEINSAQKAVVFKVNLKKPLGIKHCFFIEFVANPKSESECFLSIAPNSDFFKDLISSYPEEIAQSVLTNALISAIQKMTEIYKVKEMKISFNGEIYKVNVLSFLEIEALARAIRRYHS